MTESNASTNKNTKKKLKNWWNKKGKVNKILTGTGSCCAGLFVILIAILLLFPVTALSVEPKQVQIGNNTTEYTIQGTAEPNSTVTISAPVLNLNDNVINLTNNGSFSYQINIPLNVTEADINITAKSPKKSQNGANIQIQRVQPKTATQTSNTTSNSPTPNFNVGTSKFYLSGGFTEGFSGNGSEASRVRLDKTDTSIIVTEYSGEDLYKIESKNAESYKTIDGVTVTKLPSCLSVFFEKNGKYYAIAVNTVSADGTTSPATETSENQQYIQDIVGSMQNT